MLAQVVADLADGSTDLSGSTRCRRAGAELNLQLSAGPAEKRLREDAEDQAIVYVSVALKQAIGELDNARVVATAERESERRRERRGISTVGGGAVVERRGLLEVDALSREGIGDRETPPGAALGSRRVVREEAGGASRGRNAKT